MNRETSLYLDVLRFSAAMTVFLGHVAGERFTGGFLWQFGLVMEDAVTVFFVLSGYVIAYTTDQRENTIRSYVVARAARMYSVALPALVITFFLDCVGRSVHQDFYLQSWGYIADGQLWQFLSGLLFINQLWFLDVHQGSCLPYWSLGYEVWYYAIFCMMTFGRGHFRWFALLVLLLIVGPKIASMFPLWLVGALTYWFCGRYPLNKGLGLMLCLGALGALVGYEISLHSGGEFAITGWSGRNLARSYVVGTLLSVHLVGFHTISTWFSPVLNRFAQQIRWAAGMTFTLYLIHLPVAQFLTTQVRWPPSAWATRAVIIGGTLTFVVIMAELTERRKEPWRRAISKALNRIYPIRSISLG